MNAIVSVRDAVKNYTLGNVVVPALRGVTLDVEAGDFISIAGPSGSGKTTLLNLIGCVDTPTSGVVEVAGKDTRQLSERALTDLRLRTIGFIFQSFNLVAVLTVFQNIELPLLLQRQLSGPERKARVMGLLEKVGIGDYANHRPSELSGGQRQRVAIARALVTRPQLVLADEPTANLDSVTGQNILDLMKELNRTEKTTFIFSTHDQQVMAHANAIVRLADGKLVDRVTPAQMARVARSAGVRAWLATLGVVAQMAFRNLFASRLKTIIVGGIIFFGGLLVVAGNSLLDSLVASMSRSVIGSVAGHIQVYNAQSKDKLEVMGRMMMGDPDLVAAGRLCQGAGLAAQGPQRQVGGPDGDQRRARHLGQHHRSGAREAAQRGQGARRRQDRRRASQGRGAGGQPRRGTSGRSSRCCRAISRTPRRSWTRRPSIRRTPRRSTGRRPTRSGTTSTRTPSTGWSFSRTGSPARPPTPTCCSSTTSAPTSRPSRSRSTA